jgi:Spy/CpxP family protein refolding chaperone
MKRHSNFVQLTLVLLAAGAVCAAQAQGRGGPSGGGGGPRGGMGGGAAGMGGTPFPGPSSRSGGSMPNRVPPPQQPSTQRTQSTENPIRVGLQLGPPGQRWWDDRGYVKSLKLRADQQSRMDAIFEQNRNALLSRFEGLQQAEAEMEQLSNSSVPDEGALFSQIDRVAQARAELEKANTHMLLQIRKEMDPDQIKRLESKR